MATVTNQQYDHKKKTMKLIVRGSSGYPIWYERTYTLKELKEMVATLDNQNG